MQRLRLWFGILLLCLGFGSVAYAQNKPYCDLKGAAYALTDQNQADYRVYEEKSEAFADLIVFKSPNVLFADRSGLWFLTPTRAQAAFTVCFVKERAMADFTVFFIDNESFAGCR